MMSAINSIKGRGLLYQFYSVVWTPCKLCTKKSMENGNLFSKIILNDLSAGNSIIWWDLEPPDLQKFCDPVFRILHFFNANASYIALYLWHFGDFHTPGQCTRVTFRNEDIQLTVTFFFLNIYLVVYLWLHWVLVSARGPSPAAASGSHSLLWCAGPSLRWPLPLWSTGSRLAGFSSCGTWAQ